METSSRWDLTHILRSVPIPVDPILAQFNHALLLPTALSPEEREMIEDGLEEHSQDVMGVHRFEFFAGDEKLHLREFIRFCRLGSFVIL